LLRHKFSLSISSASPAPDAARLPPLILPRRLRFYLRFAQRRMARYAYEAHVLRGAMPHRRARLHAAYGDDATLAPYASQRHCCLPIAAYKRMAAAICQFTLMP